MKKVKADLTSADTAAGNVNLEYRKELDLADRYRAIQAGEVASWALGYDVFDVIGPAIASLKLQYLETDASLERQEETSSMVSYGMEHMSFLYMTEL